MTIEDFNSQELVYQLADFIELRFGVYLDTIMGFKHNLEHFKGSQQQAVQLTKLPIEELDKLPISHGKGGPSSDLEECKRRELHRMTQADFKKNNTPGGANFNFAIENCLSDIFNYWNSIKEKSGFNKVNDSEIFPVAAYMRELRNRIQHDLYPERAIRTKKGSITIGKTITSYAFPIFEEGQTIRLSEEDIESLVFEVRAQLNEHLIPYINSYVQCQIPIAPQTSPHAS